MIVLTELRKIGDSLPDGARVTLMTGYHLTENKTFAPLPTGTTEVSVWVNDLWYTFYVKDEEWEQNTVADEIIVHMRSLLP